MPARSPRPAGSKMGGISAVAAAVGAARRAGKRVVFTNGVFDLLHPGHVMLLQKARAMGDLLVVAVNSDASVRRLKGPERPFIAQRDRALMLAALEAVDHVVIFTQDTPQRLIERLRPDVLVKGGDWKAGSIVGRQVVEGGGGKVVRIRVREGFSTTRIAGSIRRRGRR